jgi:hypothetical protein
MSARSILTLEGCFSSLREATPTRGSTKDYALQRQTLHEHYKSANVIETSNSLPPSQHAVVQLSMSGLVMSLFILSMLSMIISACIARRNQHSLIVELPSTITCSNCRYFNDNYFLKCALHPVTVMTEQAVDCRDYCPMVKTKQTEKFRKILLKIQKVFS